MQYDGKNIRNYIQYFLQLVLFSLCAFFNCICLVCIVVIVCVFVISYVYLFYAVLTLDAGLLARSQYPEGSVTGHLTAHAHCMLDT